MKYNEKNPPLVCMQTQSKCYKKTRKMEIKGILWHDTGANNAYIKRYVQPSDNAPDREEMLKILGKNQYNNDWNHTDREAGMNCFVGKLADGTVATVQTMPWDYRPWGCGSGKKGSCNNGWIQFEICEDGKTSAEYLEAAYREACEITAYLCLMFGIDPYGTADCGGVTVPTILCHYDSYKLGLGSNHNDIYDWFPKFGKSMETVRDDVAALIRAEAALPEEKPEKAETDEEKIWSFLLDHIGNAYGAAGMMGNLYAESALRSINLQNTYEKSLGMTDQEYTAQVDSGGYGNFADDRAGYGLAQWTYPFRKAALLAYAQEQGKSIGDMDMQLNFLWKELQSYSSVLAVLQSAQSVREASDAVLLKYEKPADQSETAQERRAGYGQTFYDRYASQSHSEAPESAPDSTLTTGLQAGSKGSEVATMQSMLISCGYALPRYGADGNFGAETLSAVKQFQQDHGLTVDGIVGKKTYAALLDAYSQIIAESDPERVYTVTISGLSKVEAEKIINIYGGELSVG